MRRFAFAPGRRLRVARACRPPAISDQASRAVGKDRPGGAASSRGLAHAVLGFRPGRPATVFVSGLVTIRAASAIRCASARSAAAPSSVSP